MDADLHDAACVTCLLRRALGAEADLDWEHLPAAPDCPFRRRTAARVAVLRLPQARTLVARNRAAS